MLWWNRFCCCQISLSMSKCSSVIHTHQGCQSSCISTKAARGQRDIKHINLWQLTPSRIDACGFSDIKTFTAFVKVNLWAQPPQDMKVCFGFWSVESIGIFSSFLSPAVVYSLLNWIRTKAKQMTHISPDKNKHHLNLYILRRILHVELPVWQPITTMVKSETQTWKAYNKHKPLSLVLEGIWALPNVV